MPLNLLSSNSAKKLETCFFFLILSEYSVIQLNAGIWRWHRVTDLCAALKHGRYINHKACTVSAT